jgi:pentatricopeptide repeat protein
MRVTLLVITIGIVVCAFGSVVSPVAAFTSLSQGSTPRLSQSPQSQPFPQRRCDTTFLRTTRTTAETPSTLRPLPTTSSHPVFAVVQDFQLKKPWKDGTTPLLQTRTCNIVLGQLTDSPRPDAAGAAERILRYMLQNAHAPGAPDVVSLNSVLACYSKLGSDKDARGRQQQRDAAEHSYRVLREWQELYSQGMVAVNADRISYNTVLAAFCRSGQTNRAEQVFAELQRLGQATDNNDDDDQNNAAYRPDVVSYATLIRAYAIQGQATPAEALFQQMKRQGPPPSVECYNNVLYAYSKSSRPDRAVEFLQWWLDDDAIDLDESVQPDVRSYNIVLHALAQSSDLQSVHRAERLLDSMPQRDSVSYTTYVAACCRLSGRSVLDAVQRALDKAYADEHVHVDAAFLSNILYSLATCDEKDMPVFAEELVTTMTTQHGVDDSVLAVYNALIHCWAKSGERDAVPRVLAILRYLEAQTTVQPDIKTYTNVLDCLAKSRDRQSHVEAEALLQRMEELGPPPNVQAYTSLIQNFSRSRLPYKAVKASEILQRMKASANPLARPNVVTYNAVLNAAEHTDTSDKVATEEALKVACLTFDEIRSSTVRPNHVTYGTFLGVLANLMPIDSRHEIVSLVFRRCCLEGQVSRFVLKKLRGAAVTEDILKQLLQGHSESQLPTAWTCHVRESKARNA